MLSACSSFPRRHSTHHQTFKAKKSLSKQSFSASPLQASPLSFTSVGFSLCMPLSFSYPSNSLFGWQDSTHTKCSPWYPKFSPVNFKKLIKETGLWYQQEQEESSAYPHQGSLQLCEILAFPYRSFGKMFTGELFNCLTWILISYSQ